MFVMFEKSLDLMIATSVQSYLGNARVRRFNQSRLGRLVASKQAYDRSVAFVDRFVFWICETLFLAGLVPVFAAAMTPFYLMVNDRIVMSGMVCAAATIVTTAIAIVALWLSVTTVDASRLVLRAALAKVATGSPRFAFATCFEGEPPWFTVIWWRTDKKGV